VQQGDPGGALPGLGGVGDPDVLAGEQQDAAEDGTLLGLPQVVAGGQRGRAALELEPVAFQGQAGQRDEVDEPGGQVGAQSLPCLELALVGVLDVLDDLRGGGEGRGGEGVGEDLGAEVEVGVAVADENGGQRLAGVQDRGGQPVPVGAGEAGVDQQRLALAGDQGGGLVLAPGGEVQVQDREVQRAHESSLSVTGMAAGKLSGEGGQALVHLVGGGVPARQGDDLVAVVGEQGGKSGDAQPP